MPRSPADERQSSLKLMVDPVVRERRTALLLEHQRRIFSWIRRITRDEDDALDLLQDVCVAVLQSPMDFGDQRHFLRWARGVVQHTARQSYRHRTRRTRLEAEIGGVCRGSGFEPVANPEACVASRQLLDRGAAGLDRKSLELVLARYVDQASARELASGTRQSPAAMRVKLSRLRASIRRALS